MRAGWADFRLALGFLTIFPAGAAQAWTPRRLGRSMALFPAVGLTLGLGLVVLDWLLGMLIPRAVLDCLLLLILILVSGALHLDGFADLIDGLAGGRGREEALRIMKDSRVGAMGVIGLVMLLLLKYLALYHIPLDIKAAALVLMPTAGRWLQVVLASFCRYLRAEPGTGAAFVAHAGERELLFACITLLAAALVLFGGTGVWLCLLFALAAALLLWYFERRLGGVTGDVLGAASEVMEVLALLAILAIC